MYFIHAVEVIFFQCFSLICYFKFLQTVNKSNFQIQIHCLYSFIQFYTHKKL